MHHLWERVHILQVMSHWMDTNTQLILSEVSQSIVGNHFSSTTTWLPVTSDRWGLITMVSLSGLIIGWQNLHQLQWVTECSGEGGVAIRLQRADCHLHLGKILGESFSPESGGMPNATKLMASVVCICNSGLDYLLGVPTGIAICCVPPMSPRMFGSNDYMVRDMITVLVLCYTCTI